MKKSFSRYFLPFVFLLLPFVLTGCFEDEITFKGKVLQAHWEYWSDGTTAPTPTGRYIVDGPLPGAIVRCVGYSETATTDTNGLYELNIEVSRVIGYKAKADSFTLQAFSQRTYNNPNWDLGTDEPISQYVDARPGDTIPVRAFVLMSHTFEGDAGGAQQ